MRTAAIRLSVLLALILGWAAASLLLHDRRLPGPAEVLAVLRRELASGRLAEHFGATLGRVAVCFVLAMLAGSALGYAMGRRRSLDRWLDGPLLILLNIPALIVVILCYVWIGLTETALVLAVTLIKIPNVAVAIREGARTLDPDLDDVAQVFAMGRWRRVRSIVLPQLAPWLLAASRNGLALIWKIVLVVELLGRSSGVGFRLQLAFQTFDIAGLLAYALAFIAIVLLIEAAVLRPLERRLGAWRR